VVLAPTIVVLVLAPTIVVLVVATDVVGALTVSLRTASTPT
jgi:hypothetical protein